MTENFSYKDEYKNTFFVKYIDFHNFFGHCKPGSRELLDKTNPATACEASNFTKNHMEYNDNGMRAVCYTLALMLFIRLFRNNMGIRFGTGKTRGKFGKVMNNVVHYLLIVLRVGLVIAWLILAGPHVLWIVHGSFAIIKKNEYKYPAEADPEDRNYDKYYKLKWPVTGLTK